MNTPSVIALCLLSLLSGVGIGGLVVDSPWHSAVLDRPSTLSYRTPKPTPSPKQLSFIDFTHRLSAYCAALTPAGKYHFSGISHDEDSAWFDCADSDFNSVNIDITPAMRLP